MSITQHEIISEVRGFLATELSYPVLLTRNDSVVAPSYVFSWNSQIATGSMMACGITTHRGQYTVDCYGKDWQEAETLFDELITALQTYNSKHYILVDIYESDLSFLRDTETIAFVKRAIITIVYII